MKNSLLIIYKDSLSNESDIRKEAYPEDKYMDKPKREEK